MTQRAFSFDANRCTGCQACEIACLIENELGPDTSWRRVDTFNPAHVPGAPMFHLSLACNHCVEPPCMHHCPALAYSKSSVTGAVTIDAERCIGCKYCTWVCPYDAPQFDDARGVVHKCTFCEHRLEQGKSPACVTLCPTGALGFGDHRPGQAEPSFPGFPRTGLEPAIRFEPLRGALDLERGTMAEALLRAGERPNDGGSNGTAGRPSAYRDSRIRLRSEWCLAVFSLLAAFLVGAVGAAPVTGMPPAVILIAGVIGMGLSTLHLGRKTRAWRAILNWRRSWLSREILLYSTFLGLVTVQAASGGWTAPLHVLTLVVGGAALFAIDSVYRVTLPKQSWLHSAQALWSGVLWMGALSGSPTLVLGAGTLKVVAYAVRKLHRHRAGLPWRPLATAIRMAALALPMSLWSAAAGGIIDTSGTGGVADFCIALLAVGEIIDRFEFYLELEISSPRRQLAIDLDRLRGINGRRA